MYDLWLLATGFSHIPSGWKFYCHLMQVFDERQELIKTMKGKSLTKM